MDQFFGIVVGEPYIKLRGDTLTVFEFTYFMLKKYSRELNPRLLRPNGGGPSGLLKAYLLSKLGVQVSRH
ncbi:hypothetical protein HZ326_19501 [Fusarium oxysporum f. sp. albedinis]|nr:hypothetical protein HZ326_19501 [Fusarium oxysporum f. sp. albedinis]